MGFLQLLFGNKSSEKIAHLLQKGACILDVRTTSEFKSGNYKESINIPLDSLKSKISTIKSWDKPVILVCKSGVRADLALKQLKKENIECMNAGSWKSLK